MLDGISDKMLTATLQTLESDGLVHREIGTERPPSVTYSVTDLGHREIGTERPPSVTYSVTDLGHGAIGALRPFLDWIRANADEITAHWPTSPFGEPAGPR